MAATRTRDSGCRGPSATVRVTDGANGAYRPTPRSSCGVALPEKVAHETEGVEEPAQGTDKCPDEDEWKERVGHRRTLPHTVPCRG